MKTKPSKKRKQNIQQAVNKRKNQTQEEEKQRQQREAVMHLDILDNHPGNDYGAARFRNETVSLSC
jgi:hypothetical protein